MAEVKTSEITRSGITRQTEKGHKAKTPFLQTVMAVIIVLAVLAVMSLLAALAVLALLAGLAV